jgi:hypothetical protein
MTLLIGITQNKQITNPFIMNINIIKLKCFHNYLLIILSNKRRGSNLSEYRAHNLI